MAMSRSFAATPLTTRPSIDTVPAEMDSRPAIIRSVVVFLQPEGPRRTMNSPSPTSSETSETTASWDRPNVFVSPFNVTTAMPSPHLTAPAVMPWMSFSEKKA